MKKQFLFSIFAATVMLSGCSDDNGKVPGPEEFNIAVSGSEGGSVVATANGAVLTMAEEGTVINLIATANADYIFTKWTVMKGDVTLLPDITTAEVTFTMPAKDVAIEAEFAIKAPAKYAITFTDDGNGTAEAILDDEVITEAFVGTQVTIVAWPKEGYGFTKWTVVSGEVTLLSTINAATAFIMPEENVEIKAEFASAATDGVLINGVIWATRNVGELGTFTANSEDYGLLYQWNRKTAWLTTGDDPVSSPAGEAWYPSNELGDSWASENDPCPEGWRLPTLMEQMTLYDYDSKVSYGKAIQNGINGFKYTDRTTGAYIFLPTAGRRHGSTGQSGYQGTYGMYWSSTPYGGNYAWYMNLDTNINYGEYNYNSRSFAASIRCVRDE